MRDAISGDRVRVRMSRMKADGEDEADGHADRSKGPERNKTTRRHHRRQRGFWFVIPDGTVLREPILARDASAKNAGRTTRS